MSTEPLFAYKLTCDAGFAPNPFWGCLTLATCKPGIRRAKNVGAWIAGFTSGVLCRDAVGKEKLIYLMQVTEKLRIADYFRSPRFARKIPPPISGGEYVLSVGDNIYEPIRDNPTAASGFKQVWNQSHWDGAGACTPKPLKEHDVSGQFVLVSTLYAYFGRDALMIPSQFRPNIPRGQSSQGAATHDAVRVHAFVEYVFRSAGRRHVVAAPHSWPHSDNSWRQTL
jgi:hypothetical protein